MTTYSRPLGLLSRCQRHRYFRALKDALAQALRSATATGKVDTKAFRRFVALWIGRGAPVDPAILYVPKPSLEIIIRQVAAGIPSLSEYHADAAIWLQYPEVRDRAAETFGYEAGPKRKGNTLYSKPMAPQFVPYNLLLSDGLNYAEYNRTGLTLEVSDS